MQHSDNIKNLHQDAAKEANLTPAQSPDFESLELAFLGSLLPGIVHNLATPLSGVIGATQLLEMRVGEQQRLLNDLERGTSQSAEALLVQHQKSCSNLDIMSRNARHLTELLQVIIRRFHRCGQEKAGPQSLFELVSNELQFLDANLTYKHKVRKRFDLASDVYTVHAVYKHVAAVIDEYVLRALAAHDFSRGLVELNITTNYVNSCGLLELEAKYFETDEEPLELDALNMYLARLAENGATYNVAQETGRLLVTINLPRHAPRA